MGLREVIALFDNQIRSQYGLTSGFAFYTGL